MTRSRVPPVIVLLLLVSAGCYRAPDGADPLPPVDPPDPVVTAVAPATSPREPAPTVQPNDPPRTRSQQPAPAGSPYQVRYGWGVPSSTVRVAHTVKVPLAPPPAPALPYLVELHAADHPEGHPGFTRFSFYFRGGLPSYEVAYVPEVTGEGSGLPVPLPGNSFLRIRFTPAQAHDGAGNSSIRRAPAADLDFPTLRGYRQAGDYEGYVTYGLGIQVAPNSDQVLPIRIGEMIRPDGFHVIAVDIRRD